LVGYGNILTSRNITPHQNSYMYFHIQPITYKCLSPFIWRANPLVGSFTILTSDLILYSYTTVFGDTSRRQQHPCKGMTIRERSYIMQNTCALSVHITTTNTYSVDSLNDILHYASFTFEDTSISIQKRIKTSK